VNLLEFYEKIRKRTVPAPEFSKNSRASAKPPAIQSINIPKTKRRLKNVPGVLSAGKTWGPFPIFFHRHPPLPFGSVFCLIAILHCRKKREQ
jgi:hypothetical protein